MKYSQGNRNRGVVRSNSPNPAIEAYAKKTLEQILKNRWKLATGLPWTKKSFIKVHLGFKPPGATRSELEELLEQVLKFEGGK
ncbi:MAG: hypothetical protein Q7S00_00295 [bacterium]|nr:hypothetical protein [bacterium]